MRSLMIKKVENMTSTEKTRVQMGSAMAQEGYKKGQKKKCEVTNLYSNRLNTIT